jgi:hypothetical protein
MVGAAVGRLRSFVEARASMALRAAYLSGPRLIQRVTASAASLPIPAVVAAFRFALARLLHRQPFALIGEFHVVDWLLGHNPQRDTVHEIQEARKGPPLVGRCGDQAALAETRTRGNSKAEGRSGIGSDKLIHMRANRSMSARRCGSFTLSASDNNSNPFARYSLV